MFKCSATHGYISVKQNLKLKPCCNYKAQLDETDFSKALDTWTEYFNNTSNWPTECLTCKVKEEQEQLSLRQRIDKQLHEFSNFKPVGNSVQFLEVYLDNTCNMQCIMCNPSNSSKWNLSVTQGKFLDYHKQHTQNKSNDLFELLDKNDLSNISSIRLLGGEPLYSKNLLPFLERFEHLSNNMVITFNTNGSIFPNNRILELLKKYKSVIVKFSLDAIEDVAEYTRHGTNWQELQQTIKQWVSIADSNFKFSSVPCVSLATLEQLPETIDWLAENVSSRITINLVHEEYMNINILDLKFREDVYNRITRNVNGKGLLLVPQKHVDKQIPLKYIKEFDTLGKFSFEQLCPGVYKELTK